MQEGLSVVSVTAEGDDREAMFMWAYYQMRGDPNFFNSASNQYLLNAFAENPDVVNEGGWSLYLKRTLLDYLENNGFGKLDGNYRETVFSIGTWNDITGFKISGHPDMRLNGLVINCEKSIAEQGGWTVGLEIKRFEYGGILSQMRRQKAQYFTLRQYQADFYELVEKWDQVDANSQGLFFEQFENAVNVLMGNVPGSVNLTFSPVITSDGVRGFRIGGYDKLNGQIFIGAFGH